MRSVTNHRLIKRNARIGQYTSLGALVFIASSLLIIFRSPEYLIYSLGASLIGFLLFQIGMYFSNRWGRSPRPDQLLDRSLKGLGREFTIYHYVTPASHLLASPAGLWVLLPYYQSGTISFEKKRWRAKGGGFSQAYLRALGPESIGRPELDAAAEIDAIRRYLKRILPEETPEFEINAALIFTSPKVNLVPGETPYPAMLLKDLKDFLRAKSKEKPIGLPTLETIQEALPQPDQE